MVSVSTKLAKNHHLMTSQFRNLNLPLRNWKTLEEIFIKNCNHLILISNNPIVNFHHVSNCKDFNKNVVISNWWPWLGDVKFKYEKKNQFSGQNAKVQFSVTERSNLIGCSAAINRLVKQILPQFTVQDNGVKNKMKSIFY